MKILIVSDTHGRDEKLEAAVAVEQPFDYLIHCGDVEGREFFIIKTGSPLPVLLLRAIPSLHSLADGPPALEKKGCRD